MSNWGYEDDNNANGLGNDTEGTGPKALRDAYKKQADKIESLETMVATFVQREEKRQMATVFEALGVPGAQEVYKGEADPEKAKAWVESMRTVFGNGQPQQAVTEQATAPTLPASMQAQFERLNAAGNDGTPVGNMEAAQSAVNDANDPQAIINAFRNLGA